MPDVRWLSSRAARLGLVFAALLHFAGVPLLTHGAAGSWSDGSAVHSQGQCPDGGPAHNERACRTFQTPAPDAVPGRAAFLGSSDGAGVLSLAAEELSVHSLRRSPTQARAPPTA